MEGNRRSFFKKQSNTQFKKKGGHRKETWNTSKHGQALGSSLSSETVYQILCHSRKIGGVIGKGGSIINALREETQAKITVAESVPGSDERVVIIRSPSTRIPRKHNRGNNENEDDLMEPHCAAQIALLKVHDKIIVEDIFGGSNNEDGNDVVTARLLVPNNMVGCLIGKKGDVIQRLRSETGANIRVLPADHLPICAASTDELVQISGKPAVARRALYEMSTLLHQNPRKDQPPSDFPMLYGGQGFHPPGPATGGNMPPPVDPMWSQWKPNSYGMPPMQWMGEYGNGPSGVGPEDFDGVPGGHNGEAPMEFFMKILCSSAKIGGVIGKGGSNIKQVQQETGASIHIEDVTAESDEHAIRISSSEAPWNTRSQTIDAILQLQNKTSELSDKGAITTRLLIPTNKVGCILGQGGHIINDMRRRTEADIRVYSKEDKPKCAAKDEELVQISGNFGFAKDALAEVALRLRERFMRDAKPLGEPAPLGSHPRYDHPGNMHDVGPPPSGPIGVGRSGGNNHFKGRGREYESISYPVHSNAEGYPNINSSMKVTMPNNAIGSPIGMGWNNTSDVSGGRVKLQDPMSSSSVRGSFQHRNNPQRMHHTFMSSGGQNHNPQHGSYQDFNARGQNNPPQHSGSYQDFHDYGQQHNNPHTEHSFHQDFNAHSQNYIPQRGSYADFNARGQQHNSPRTEHSSYQELRGCGQNNNLQHDSYQVGTTPQQSTYQNYQNAGTTSQVPYQNTSPQRYYQY